MRIKKILGLCECKKCLRRSIADITFKAIDKKVNVCGKHLTEILISELGRVKEVEE